MVKDTSFIISFSGGGDAVLHHRRLPPVKPDTKGMKRMNIHMSLLNLTSIPILPNLSFRIPTVGEVLEDEQHYYRLISLLTATPFQYMVQLDDIGLDFTAVTDYELFMMLFPSLAMEDTRLLFGDLDLSDTTVYENKENSTLVLHSEKSNITIDELAYTQIAEAARKINGLKKDDRRPGNKEAKEFRIKLERKKQKRNADRPYEPYLEKLVVALVNRPEFKYNYSQAKNLTLYQFHRSFDQISTSIAFDNTMIGVYAGTVDTSKLKDRSCLSWLPVK